MLYIIRFFLAFLSAYFLGKIIYFSFCTPKEKDRIISIFHSFFLGLGFTSISFWYYTIATNGFNSNYHIIEICFVGIIYLYLWLKKGKKITFPIKTNFPKNKNISRKKKSLLNYITIILFCLIAVLCFYKCYNFPDGTWDALAMWNLRARFLSCGNESWSLMYVDKFNYSHRDYPLFLPCTIARLYNFVGKIDTTIPIFFSCFFTIVCFILPYLYLCKLKNKYFSFIAVCILSYSPKILFYGCMQYADILLAIFILISIYEFIIWDIENKNLPWTCMIFACFCFWIKNEGIPWYVFFSLLIIYHLYKKDKNITVSIKKFLKIIIVSSPVIISFLSVRYLANSENDLVSGLLGRLQQIFILERYEMIMSFVWMFIKQHFWIIFIPIYLCFGFIDKKYYKYAFLFNLISIMYLIYVFVYLITPYDLTWHLETSFPRITAVYLPSILFLGCLSFDFKKS